MLIKPYPVALKDKRNRYCHPQTYANRPNVASLTNLYFAHTGPLISHKSSNCLFTTETEFDIYLLNLGKRLIVQSLYWHMLSDIIIREFPEIFFCTREKERLGLWCLTPLSTIFQLYRGDHFYWRGNWSKRRKPPTYRKSLTKLYHTMLYRVYPVWAVFKLTTLVVICTACISSLKSENHTIMTTMG